MANNNIIIRKLTSSDTEKLVECLHNLSPETKSNFGPHSFDFNTIAEICNNQSTDIYCFVAENKNDQRIVAYSILKKGILQFERFRFENYGLKPDDEHDYALATVVADDYQSKGIGSMMLEFLADELKKLKAKRIVLWGGVKKHNTKAVDYCLKHGFRVLGEFEYQGTNFDMVKNLNDLLFQSPDWLSDLIIYEINPYGFTATTNIDKHSYNGNFVSLTNKLDYIQSIGTNGIWFAGFSLASNHFKGIISVYACKRPDIIDDRLGTEQDLKNFINEAHKRGIKIFLEVVTHGVTNDSPLITEHPDWFSGSSWQMTDYDYDNMGFRQWWIKTWMNYVTEYKVDGFRLDGPNGVQPYGKVLQIWDEIIEELGYKEYPVLVFPENMPYHFQQGLHEPLNTKNPVKEFSTVPKFRCKAISNHDYGIDQRGVTNCYQLKGSRYMLAYEYIFSYNIPLLMAGEEFNADFNPARGLSLDLFGGGDTNSWLYGNCIDWKQLENTENQDMLDDFKKIVQIKHQNNDLLHYNRLKTQIAELPFTCNIPDAPVPYIRYNKGKKAIVIVGNNTDKLAEFELSIPLQLIGVELKTGCRITDLWTNESNVIDIEGTIKMHVSVLPDFTQGGGISVFKLEFI